MSDKRTGKLKAWRCECLDGTDIVEKALEKLRDNGDKAETSQRVFITQKLNDLVCAICGTTEEDLEVEQIEG